MRERFRKMMGRLQRRNSEKCRGDVFKGGTTVFVTHTISADDIEAWVAKVEERSGQQVDWSYMAGRAIVRALGDLEKVDEALRELKPEHDALYLKTIKESYNEVLDFSEEEIRRQIPTLEKWWL